MDTSNKTGFNAPNSSSIFQSTSSVPFSGSSSGANMFSVKSTAQGGFSSLSSLNFSQKNAGNSGNAASNKAFSLASMFDDKSSNQSSTPRLFGSTQASTGLFGNDGRYQPNTATSFTASNTSSISLFGSQGSTTSSAAEKNSLFSLKSSGASTGNFFSSHQPSNNVTSWNTSSTPSGFSGTFLTTSSTSQTGIGVNFGMSTPTGATNPVAVSSTNNTSAAATSSLQNQYSTASQSLFSNLSNSSSGSLGGLSASFGIKPAAGSYGGMTTSSSPSSSSAPSSSGSVSSFTNLTGNSNFSAPSSGIFGTSGSTTFSSGSNIFSSSSNVSAASSTIASNTSMASSSTSALLGSTASSAATASSSTAALSELTKASLLTAPERLALESIQHERLEDLVIKWEKRIEKQAQRFNAHAEQVAEIDKNIIIQSQKLSELRKEQQVTAAQQQHFAEVIKTIEQQQDDLAPLLSSIEADLRSRLPSNQERDHESSMVLMMSQQLQRLDQQIVEVSTLFKNVSELKEPESLHCVTEALALQEISLEAISQQVMQLEARLESLRHEIGN